jgi:hypothetical protein
MLTVRMPTFVSPFGEAVAVTSTVFDHTVLIKTVALRFLGP